MAISFSVLFTRAILQNVSTAGTISTHILTSDIYCENVEILAYISIVIDVHTCIHVHVCINIMIN